MPVTHAATAGKAYPVREFANDVEEMARRIQRLWNEALRYHKNIAYVHGVGRVKKATEWFVRNSLEL